MSQDKKVKIDLPLPDGVKVEEGAVSKVFISKGNESNAYVPSATEELMLAIMSKSSVTEGDVEHSYKKILSKSFEGSKQSQADINGTFTLDANFKKRIQQPPYDPEVFKRFLELNHIHASCVETKVRDSIGRKYKIKPPAPISDSDSDLNSFNYDPTISKEDYEKDALEIRRFVNNCNSMESFEQVLYKAAMDREAIGWGALEVIRKANGKIARLQHIPAERLRVLEGFKGFVEVVPGEDLTISKVTHRFYQNFGEKVGVKEDDPFDFSDNPKKIFRPYDPDLDGEMVIERGNIEFNIVDPKTGEPFEEGSFSNNFKEAANEILFLPRTHSSSVYYGYSPIVPAIGAVIANVHIRDYMLQFFEHNCIPRYAVIVKGAAVDDEFMEMISDYFENRVKGSAHKTMVLALTGFGNRNVELEFQKLETDGKEAEFLKTRQSNDDVIKAAHGIHDSIIGISQASSLGSGSGLSQAEQYKDRVLIPLQKFWETKLNKMFELGLGVKNAILEFDPKDVRDQESVARALTQLVQAGILDVNEARGELGYTAVDGGSTAFTRVREGSILKIEDVPNMESSIEEVDTADTVSTKANIEFMSFGAPKEE